MAKISLKAQNLPITAIYIVWLTSIYLVSLNNWLIPSDSIQAIFSKLIEKTSIFGVLLPIISYALSGLLPVAWKETICFWRIKYPLPGCRAFTLYGQRDIRVNLNKIKEKIGEIPINPIDQNKEWYSLFKRYEDSVSVNLAHKYYLLGRELTSITVLYFIIGTIILFFTSEVQISSTLYYGSILVAHYFIFAIVSQNYGKRFACTVLAEASK